MPDPNARQLDRDELEQSLRLLQDQLADRDRQLEHVLAELDKTRMERDRANLAFAELHSSHRALTIARDENGARIIQLREVKFAVEAVVRELETRQADAQRHLENDPLTDVYGETIELLKNALNA